VREFVCRVPMAFPTGVRPNTAQNWPFTGMRGRAPNTAQRGTTNATLHMGAMGWGRHDHTDLRDYDPNVSLMVPVLSTGCNAGGS
jgi:hypothetical protein